MNVLDLTRTLVSRQSVTPNDAGCQELMAEWLTSIGFEVESMPFGDVKNLWACHGNASPSLVFAGHTDVVPSGDEHTWSTPPFEPTVTEDGRLIGRGTADMKASLAAMLTATRRFVEAHQNHRGSIGFLITSDEEGPAVDGTVRVIDALRARNQQIDYCLVGEPSSNKILGDTIRNGRRGSLSGIMKISGMLGHVAYPQARENPMHALGRFVAAITAQPVDDGNSHFPPTTFQMVNVHSDAGAPNVVPDELKCRFNFRYNTNWTHTSLSEHVEQLLQSLNIDYEITWRVAGEPFITKPGILTDAVLAAVHEVTGVDGELSTSGGTSDGRFIAPHGIDVVELGPINQTIHQINEEVKIDDIFQLEEIYYQILCKLLIN